MEGYKSKRILALTLATVMGLGCLSGCSGETIGTSAKDFPLQPALTQQEVLDYYAEALSYDTIIKRDVDENVTSYELKKVSDDKIITMVTQALANTEALLKNPAFVESSDNKQFLNDSLYTYIRATLNDKLLTNPQITNIYQALGYYFVDVEYDIRPAQIGNFTNLASLIGINGAFRYSEALGADTIDTAYLEAAVISLEDYYKENKMAEVVVYNPATNEFKTGTREEIAAQDYAITGAGGNAQVETPTEPVTPETGGIVDIPNEDVPLAPGDEVEVNDELTVENTETTETPEVNEGTESTENIEDEGYEPLEVVNEPNLFGEDTQEEFESGTVQGAVDLARAPRIDVDDFHSIVGSIRKAYIPEIELIYSMPRSSELTGSGMYPSGSNGLKIFGVNRAELDGKMTLRYVFKSELTNPSKLSISNIYVTSSEIYSGVNTESKTLIPDFLDNTFDILIDKADRAQLNCDITALANNKIYTDLGQAVLTGYKAQGANTLRQVSTLRRIISRDITNNAYLVEVESFVQEGAKSADVYGSYKDKVYMVIQQHGEKFVISDYMVMSRQLVEAPDINPDSSVEKRVVALGLTGVPSDDTKNEANKLLDALYFASSNRRLRGPWTDANGNEVERGMYDCFNENATMTSSAKFQEINSRLQNKLVKYGTDITSSLNGTVTEYIGGTGNQIELTTEEVITYQGRNDGVYMTCYYLITAMEDTWVIDERTVLEEQELEGEALQTVVNRIGQ